MENWALNRMSRPIRTLTAPNTKAPTPPPRKEPIRAVTPTPIPMMPRMTPITPWNTSAASPGLVSTRKPATTPKTPIISFHHMSVRSTKTAKIMKAPWMSHHKPRTTMSKANASSWRTRRMIPKIRAVTPPRMKA